MALPVVVPRTPIQKAYENYLTYGLATASDYGELYFNNWLVKVWEVDIHPYPNRHFTFEEFQSKLDEDTEFKDKFFPQ